MIRRKQKSRKFLLFSFQMTLRRRQKRRMMWPKTTFYPDNSNREMSATQSRRKHRHTETIYHQRQSGVDALTMPRLSKYFSCSVIFSSSFVLFVPHNFFFRFVSIVETVVAFFHIIFILDFSASLFFGSVRCSMDERDIPASLNLLCEWTWIGLHAEREWVERNERMSVHKLEMGSDEIEERKKEMFRFLKQIHNKQAITMTQMTINHSLAERERERAREMCGRAGINSFDVSFDARRRRRRLSITISLTRFRFHLLIFWIK